MTCSQCGSAAPPNARFCSECGNALQATCSGCGSSLLPGAKSCAECGRAARALLRAGDSDGVRSGRVIDLHRRTIRAALTAVEGDRDAAAREYAAILPEVAEMGLVYEQAQVVVDMALVLGPDAPVVQGSVDEARAILTRLGAVPLATRLEELMREPAGEGSASGPGMTTAEATASGTVQP